MGKGALKFIISSCFLTLSATATLMGKVITYPAPITEKANTSYAVYADGKPVDIYKSLSPQFEGGEYYFAIFDFDGKVEIKVESEKPLDKAEIFPARTNVVSRSDNSITLTADKAPFCAVILRDERNMPLVIFGNPIETDVPNPNAKDVVYFGPGVHVLPEIRLTDNQTLYIAGGAVVKSRVYAQGKNITVRGRGIISGDLYERKSLPKGYHFIDFKKCQNAVIRDIVLKDPPSWTLVTFNTDGFKIDNLKICASRMLNDDAIDLCNTSNVEIKNTFARAQDDIIAIKGMYGDMPCENIEIEDCIFWTDIANIFRIGYECTTPRMANIRVKNVEIPYYAVNYRGPEEYWAKGIIWFQATNNMPMHNIDFENITVRSNGNDMCMLLANPRKVTRHADTNPGRVFDCSLKNIKVYGKKGKFKGLLYFCGYDENSHVKNIKLENITYFGEKIDSSYRHFKDEKKFTSEISVK